MCFGGPKEPDPTPAPAPAPAPPNPVAVTQDPEQARKSEDAQNFGTSNPSLRVDRSVSSGGSTAGGTGIKM